MPSEVTVAEAQRILGMAREQVMALLRDGELVHWHTGTEVMVDADSIRVFQESEQERSRTAMADLSALQNDLGLTD